MKTRLLFLILLFFFVSSCKSESELKPSDIYYGEDICERCKMIISESDFAAQYILSNNKVEKFDDIGCMLHYLNDQENLGKTVLKLFVKDYETKKWIDGEEAYYVRSKDINTPMGHGIIAFKNRDDAEKVKGDFHGNFIQVRQFIISSDK